MQDSVQARHLTTRDKGKEHIVSDDVDTSTDDELSSAARQISPQQKIAGPGRAKDTRITLHSAMPIMARSIKQEKK